jgi:archaellum component FlaG (FlaF/FlaG flagellin family)
MSLILEDSSACNTMDTATTTIYVHDTTQVEADFTVDQLNLICDSSVTLSFQNQSIGGASYTWFIGQDSIINAPSATYTFTDTGTYPIALEVTRSGACSFPDSAFQTRDVRFYSSGSIDGSSNDTICPMDTVALSASGGSGYQWNTGASGSSLTVNPEVSTQYKVTVTDTNGCVSTDSVRIFVHDDQSDADIIGLDSVYCKNDGAVSLNANPPNGSFEGPGINGNQFDPSAAGSGQHPIIYHSIDSNGCEQMDTSTIEVTQCSGIAEQSNNPSVKAYPNPFENKIIVDIENAERNKMGLGLYDVSGRLIKHKSFEKHRDSKQYMLSLSPPLAEGIYFLKIKLNDRVHHLKLNHLK